MSTILRFPTSPQGAARAEPAHNASLEPAHERAARLALALTPAERHTLARAGLPRWLELPTPWLPCPGSQLATARRLAAPDHGLLEPMPTFLGAFRLTPLGELVAGAWLLVALVDLADLADPDTYSRH